MGLTATVEWQPCREGRLLAMGPLWPQHSTGNAQAAAAAAQRQKEEQEEEEEDMHETRGHRRQHVLAAANSMLDSERGEEAAGTAHHRHRAWHSDASFPLHARAPSER